MQLTSYKGPTGMWWKHHHTTFPPNTHITWREFIEAFRGVYIPPGLTEIKLGEFLSLNQGTKTMMQYLHAFNNLSCYASDMVNTDAKKIASFKRGLNPKMMKHVGTNTRLGFNDFVNDCLKQEKNNNVYVASKTSKRAFESGPSQPRAPMTNCSTYHLPAPGARFRPPQRKNQNAQQPQRNQKPFKMAVPQAKTGPDSSSRAATQVTGPCFNCNQPRHFAKFCPYPKKQQNQYQACVHHTTIDDILEGEPVTANMFSINNYPTIVLFYFGSSHLFISQAFARKYEQKIVELECTYHISSARADLLTN
jgi:hypothetical protein